jgi:hypothetical protein
MSKSKYYKLNGILIYEAQREEHLTLFSNKDNKDQRSRNTSK